MIRVTYNLQRDEQKAGSVVLGAPARVARQKKAKPSWPRSVFGWMLFVGLTVFFFMLMRSSNVRGRSGVRVEPPAPVTSLWGLYVAIAGFVLLFVTMWVAAYFNALLVRRKIRGTVFTFTEDGVTQELQGVRTFMRWSYFDSFAENEAILVLRCAGEGLVLPKRLFAAADLAALQTLLVNKLVVPVPSLVGGFEVRPT